MAEATITLGNLNPVDLFGANESKIERIRAYFPKIKIISRGNELKVLGDDDEIKNFELRIALIKKHINKYNSISEEDINKILGEPITEIQTDLNKDDGKTLVFGTNGKPIKARTETQIKMVSEFEQNDLLFAIGPAGTGKTYLAITLAIRALKNREVRKIILSRPAVEAGEKLGFLPGDMKEKLDPYLQALYDALYDMIPARKLENMMEDRIIQIAPLAFMRGRTLSNAVVILDEAQNTTVNQIKMFLTRMGENSKFIVTGDITQIDLPNKNDSGLLHSFKVLRNIKGISFVNFTKKDVVRHPIVKKIIAAYEGKLHNESI